MALWALERKLARAVAGSFEFLVADSQKEATIINRAVYDVDVIQRALQHFGRFIYKVPHEQQIRTIRLLVNQVTLFKDKDKVGVEFHELPIADLQKALNIKTGGGGPGKFRSHIPPKTLQPNPNRQGTAAVESDANWRGRHPLNATGPSETPVPPLQNSQYFPCFSIAWPHEWVCIANGETVIVDRAAVPLAEPRIPGFAPLEGQFESRRLRGRWDSNRCPDGAENGGK